MPVATFTPIYVDGIATPVIAPQALARGAVARATVDLRAVYGAYILCLLGRGGVTALTDGVNVIVRPAPGGDALVSPATPHLDALSDTAAAYAKQINNAGGYVAGQTVLSLDGTGTPASGDKLCFWGFDAVQAGGTALPNLEFARAAAFSGANLTVDSPAKKAKIDNELVTNQANGWRIWCPGGDIYAVIFDYANDAAGEAVAIAAYATPRLTGEQGA